MIALIFFEVAFPATPTDSVEKRRYPGPARGPALAVCDYTLLVADWSVPCATAK